MASVIPTSLYIHIPWCVRKCPYCDFNSHAKQGNLPEKEYIEALLRDLVIDIDTFGARPLHSIFIGGGTPSLFSPSAIEHLIDSCRALLPCPSDIEITLEANPGSVEQERFSGFYRAGINRISLGVQSFQNNKLKKLGRIHQGEDAIKAVSAIKAAGFKNFNIDLMFGLPGQTKQEALSDLQSAIDLSPSHLSWYQLSIEPGTAFYKQPPSLPKHDQIWNMQKAGQHLLASKGFLQYEISAYARTNSTCQHNLNYWLFGDYYGIGAGAHGKLTDSTTQKITRTAKQKQPTHYLTANTFTSEKKLIDPQELPFEFMLNTLRLNQAIPLNLFTERTFLNTARLEEALQKAQTQGFLSIEKKLLKKTKLGQQFLNDLVELFL